MLMLIESEQGTVCPVTGATDYCKLLCLLGSQPAPLQESHVLLTAEQSLQTL